MSHQTHDSDDRTIPSRRFPVLSDLPEDHVEDSPSEPLYPTEVITRPLPPSAPWLVQQHFTQQIDLGAELAFRYPALPLLSVTRFRPLDARHGVALLATADGVASLVVDADGASGSVDLAFSFASALALHFRLDHLSTIDRSAWLERMRRDKDGVAFLWSQSRWEQDYLISVLQRRFVNLYAFSQQQFTAAARLTPEAAGKLFDWLETLWTPGSGDTQPPQLLTW
ncbi:MAG: hypothetical protein HZC41_15905 [Chloroflexi bacterium]|nr:hypothetical protein [Chloroflexota bacterium]